MRLTERPQGRERELVDMTERERERERASGSDRETTGERES